jgi:hypothetical protein
MPDDIMEEDRPTHLNWRQYAEPDVAAFIDRALDPLERLPYAVPTGADRYKPLEARGMPIKAKHKEPGKRRVKMANRQTVIIWFEVVSDDDEEA